MDAIFDTHLHVWDPTILNLEWLDDAPEFNRAFSIQEYLREAEPLGIAEIIYMEVDAHESCFQTELDCVHSLLEDSGSRIQGAVMGGRLDAPDFSDWLDVLLSDPRVYGVREVLHTPQRPAGHCLQPAFLDGVRLLGARGLVFDACVRVGELTDVAALAKACPNTTIVLDHLGNPPIQDGPTEAWRSSLEAVARQPNTVGKMSGLIQNTSAENWTTEDFAPFMELFITAFGPQRIVWGSNWPVCGLDGSLSRWVQTTLEVLMGYSDAEKSAVLHDNAQRIYGMD